MRGATTARSVLVAIFPLVSCASQPTVPSDEASTTTAADTASSSETDELALGPYPVSVAPARGATGVVTDKVVRVRFSDQLDSRTIGQAQLNLHSGPVTRWVMAYFDPVEVELVVWASQPMLKNAVWVLELNPGLTGLDGEKVPSGEVARFRTGSDAGDNTPYEPRRFDKDIQPFFAARCASCHGGERGVAGLRLDSGAAVAESAIGKPAQGWPDFPRISPDLPGLSYLVYKIIGDRRVSGRPMPCSFDEGVEARPLEADEKKALSDWIAGGAPIFDGVETKN